MVKKKLLLLCSYAYLFVYLYIYVLNYLFSCPGSLWPHQSFFGHRFVAVLAYKQKCVTSLKLQQQKKGSRLQDDNAVIVGPHFDFLDCSHDLKNETPSAQLLFWHATWGRMEERIIGFATVEFTLRRPGTCLFDHARRKKTHGAALVRSFFCPNILASKLVFWGEGGGTAVCTSAVCSQQLSECRFQKVCAYITQQEKAKQT